MPLRLIEFIIIFVVFLMFIIFNLGNKCDINFGFRLFKDVPVFITAFSAFILGMVCAMPFILGFRSKKKAAKEKNSGKAARGKRPGNGGVSPERDNSYTDGGPYGVN